MKKIDKWKKIALITVFALNFLACGKEETRLEEIKTVSAVDIDSLNPYQVVSSASEQLLLNVFEGLIMPSSDGSVSPALAESYEISEDGKTYTFSIRDGVTFHNGKIGRAS